MSQPTEPNIQTATEFRKWRKALAELWKRERHVMKQALAEIVHMYQDQARQQQEAAAQASAAAFRDHEHRLRRLEKCHVDTHEKRIADMEIEILFIKGELERI